MAPGLAEPRRAEIVVAVHGGPAFDAGDAIRTVHRIGHQLGVSYPGRRAVVLLLSESAERAAAVPIDPRPPPPEVPLLPWSHPGQSALEATLRAAEAFDASAAALVVADGEEGTTGGARHLLGPILDDGADLTTPCYATQRYEGVLSTGLVYPLTRALFGRRLRQPLGNELAVSRRAVAHLLGEGWHADPTHAGDRVWLVCALLSGDFRVSQACLATRPPRLGEAGADLAASLAQVVGLLFHEARLHAASWQRVKGSRPVKTYGELSPPEDAPGPPQLAPMLNAFQLGHQELQRVWSAVLPPQSMLALKRLAREPEDRFGIDDALWARVVYDFAVGYHLALMDRALLLRSMTPLYLGWAAGFVRELSSLAAPAVEVRVERLCQAFEVSKPYLISRWRWPDRFNP
jgi:glucosylglycerate synthase